MHVRARIEPDLDGCVELAAAVKASDGYPPHLPHELSRFVASADALASWVADEDERVVGHVAIHRTTSDAVMTAAADVLDLPWDALGVVARLFVAPDRRGRGIGGQLLSTATEAVVARGLVPILDVATHFTPAIALYEKHGWVRIGDITVVFRERCLHEFVYLGPGT